MAEELEVGSISASITMNNEGLVDSVEESVKSLQKLKEALTQNQCEQQNSNLVVARAAKGLKALESQIEKNGEADEKQKKKIAELNNIMEQERSKIAQLKAEQEKLEQAVSAASQAADKQTQATAETAEATEKLTENSQKLGDNFSALKVAAGNLVSDGLEKIGSKALDIGRDIIQAGQDFTASMSEVQAISGANEFELEKLREAARKFGSETVFSASDSAQALKYMALAGWDAEKSISALPGVLKAAAATGMSLGQASDLITDYLSAFNMQADQAIYMSDLLTYAQGNSNTSAEQLGEAWRNSAANLNAAGQDIETTTSMLEAMANQGKKGSEAGTMMSAIMRDLTDKMENGEIKIGNTSIKVQDLLGNFRDLTDIMIEVEQATDGMGTAQRAAALSSVFTAESINGINLILNEGMDKVSGYEEALRNSMGSASEAADIMSDNLSGDLKAMDSAFDELKLKIYDNADAPIRGVIQTITEKGVPTLESLMNNIDKIIPLVITAAAAMGSYKAALAIQSIINGLRDGFTQLAARITAVTAAEVAETSATESATAAQTGLNAAMAANPIGLVVGAIGGLISLLVTLSITAEKTKSASDELNESLKNTKEAAESTVARVEGEAEVIRKLGERYEELRTKTEKTQADWQELTMLSEQLAEKLDITTDKIRDQSGEYQSLSTEIANATQKMVEQAQVQAAQNLLTQATEARYKAQEGYNKKLDELIDKGVYYYAKHGEVVLDSSKITSKAMLEEAGELSKLSAAYREADSMVEFYSNELTNLNRNIADNALFTATSRTASNHLNQSLQKTVTVTETAEEKIKRLNLKLKDNEKAVSDVKKEIESVEQEIEATEGVDSEANSKAQKRLKELKSQLSDLNSKQTDIKNGIKEIEEELEKDANAVADSLDTVQSSAQDLQKVQKEVDENHKISLATLTNLIKKYPELSDLVSDYIKGVKTETDVITGLKKVYDKDVGNYNATLAMKELKQNSYIKNAANASAELVNKYKDHYGIDLKNFVNAAEAKAAAQEKLYDELTKAKAKYDEMVDGSNYKEGQNAYGRWVMYKDPNGNWRQLDPENNKTDRIILKNYDEEKARRAEALSKANSDYYHFDADKFEQELQEDLKKIYKGVGADTILNLSNTGSDKTGSGGSSSDKSVWKMSAWGVDDVEGSTYAQSYLNWIAKVKNLGKLTVEQEIKFLEDLKKHEGNNAEDRYLIEYQLAQAKEKLAQQNETLQAEALQKEYDRIDRLSQRGQLSTRQEIDQLEKVYQKYKLTTEQKIALEDKLYQKKQQLRDEEISSLDKLGDAVVSALKNKYEQQKELEEKRIDDSIENWKKWEDETVDAIQGQINALDDLKNAHDEENKRQEYENKRQALELQARYEKDDYNRKQIEKQIAALDKEESERLFNVSIEEQKKALQEQADNIKQISSENQEQLQKQKDTIPKTYSELMSDIALQGEAQKFILESTQDQIVSLINSYAKDYEMLGQSLGERLYAGMTGKVDDIITYIGTIANRTDTAGERTVEARKLDAYLSGTDSRRAAIAANTLSGSGIVSKIESVINGFADTINQISANATALKKQMAITANATADKYYEVQKQYYNSTNNKTNISKPVTINMTVNFNEKVDSPVEVRRQMESFSQQLAKEILSGSG